MCTGEPSLLGSTIQELHKVTSAESGNPKEDLYLSHLVCSRQTNGTDIHLGLVKAIFTSVSAWCDDKLQDYHLHFGKVSSRSMIIYIILHILFNFSGQNSCMVFFGSISF